MRAKPEREGGGRSQQHGLEVLLLHLGEAPFVTSQGVDLQSWRTFVTQEK